MPLASGIAQVFAAQSLFVSSTLPPASELAVHSIGPVLLLAPLDKSSTLLQLLLFYQFENQTRPQENFGICCRLAGVKES